MPLKKQLSTINKQRLSIVHLLSLVLVTALISISHAIETKPIEFNDVGIQENIGQQIPLNMTFTQSDGTTISLQNYIQNSKKPIILNLVYYNCPMLCSLLLDGLTNGVNTLSRNMLRKFNILTLSFDPKDTYQKAKKYKVNYTKKLSHSVNPDFWKFAIGSKDTIQKITNTVGFNYKYIPNTQDFSHSPVLILLTPEGKISRYLYGIDFSKQNLKLGILEASNQKFVSTIEKTLLYCYNYDPDARSFVINAFRIMRIGAALTIILIGLFLYLLKRKKIV